MHQNNWYSRSLEFEHYKWYDSIINFNELINGWLNASTSSINTSKVFDGVKNKETLCDIFELLREKPKLDEIKYNKKTTNYLRFLSKQSFIIQNCILDFIIKKIKPKMSVIQNTNRLMGLKSSKERFKNIKNVWAFFIK